VELPASGAVLGVDVGFSPKRRTTGFCILPQVDQAAPPGQSLLRQQRERRKDPNLDRRFGVRFGGHRPQEVGSGGELALAKLQGHFVNVHIADNVPVNTEHLPIGDGIIDWKEFFGLLAGMGYDGHLGLDRGMRKSLVRAYRSSVKHIQSIAADLGISVEV
jgi:hypothetical protein